MEHASPLTIRMARPADAAAVARVYVSAWQDCYPGLMPFPLLTAMSERGQSARWLKTIAGGGTESVLVAEQTDTDGPGSIIGMACFGPARDIGVGFEGEIYALYVAPNLYGCGVGRALLKGCFMALSMAGQSSAVIWAHAQTPARFFYEAMGGKPVAERITRVMGEKVPETAYGWRKLVLTGESEATAD